MDVIFDVDGTLADASHRLHFIRQKDGPPDWDAFLSDEQVAGDKPIEPVWRALLAHIQAGQQIIFITGRPERQRRLTWGWLRDRSCPIRELAHLRWASGLAPRPEMFMRADGDHRPSEVVKRDLLYEARMEGLNPTLAYEDRAKDTFMWRSEGLICCQVAEGNY